jgi:hypothetical protein
LVLDAERANYSGDESSAVTSLSELIPHKRLHTFLRLRVWLGEIVRPTELQVTLFWAGVIGFAGACASVAFRKVTALVHGALTQQGGGYVESFTHLNAWQRLAVPAAGGVLKFISTTFQPKKDTPAPKLTNHPSHSRPLSHQPGSAFDGSSADRQNDDRRAVGLRPAGQAHRGFRG